jgi:hypothetical protein
VRGLRRGLWALDLEVAPFAVAPFLTAPFPAYVSFWSALYRHQMIEQIPRQVSVASLDRARAVETAIGAYEIHHIAPELFGGYDGSQASGYLASPEKALFDAVYVGVASGSRAFFPELLLPENFNHGELRDWIERIESLRLRTLVGRRLGKLEAFSNRADADRGPRLVVDQEPGLVIEEGHFRSSIEVLGAAAHGLRFDELDAVQLLQDPHVVGNLRKWRVQLAMEFAGAGAAAVEGDQDLRSERVIESEGEAPVQRQRFRPLASTSRADARRQAPRWCACLTPGPTA